MRTGLAIEWTALAFSVGWAAACVFRDLFAKDPPMEAVSQDAPQTTQGVMLVPTFTLPDDLQNLLNTAEASLQEADQAEQESETAQTEAATADQAAADADANSKAAHVQAAADAQALIDGLKTHFKLV